MFLLDECPKKVTYNRWLGAPTIVSSSLNIKLEMFQIMDYRGSWINIMLIFLWFSKIISVKRHFLWIFLELLGFFVMLVMVEAMFSEQSVEAICLVIVFAVDTFEHIYIHGIKAESSRL